MPDTATTAGARAHARAQAGAHAPYGPTIPASDAVDLPAGVARDAVVWDETVAPGGSAARLLPRGATLRLADPDGDASANLILFSGVRPIERLNVADTVKVQWQAYLGTGSLLLSDMGRVLATIVRDTSGGHDAFCGASTRASNAVKYGDGSVSGPTPNARDRFAVELAKHGLDRRDIVPNLNLFKHVRIEEDGSLRFEGERASAGAVVELRCELPLLAVVANTPHVLDPRDSYTVTPLRLTAWTGRATSPDDPQWSATPEGTRAYQNTADHLLELGSIGA